MKKDDDIRALHTCSAGRMLGGTDMTSAGKLFII